MLNTPNGRDFHRYPMLLLAIYFAGGIASGHSHLLNTPRAFAAFASVVVICLIARKAAAFLVPLIFLPLGAIAYDLETRNVSADRIKRIYDGRRIESFEPVEIEGALNGFPEPAAGGWTVRIRVTSLAYKQDKNRVTGDIRLFVVVGDPTSERDYAELDLRHGSVVRVACRLEREDRYLNPGVMSTIRILDERGTDATGTVKSPLLIEKLGEDSTFLPLTWAYRARLYLIEQFRSKLSPEAAGVMIASLLGDDNFLDRRTAEVFRDGGTFHVLVISGLHITFIGGLVLWLTLFVTHRIVIRSILAAALLWAYTFSVGAEIPVVRASLMFSFLLLARITYREGSLLNALGTCTLLILLWRPGDLFSASFQLTFVSVAAIVGCSFPLIEKCRMIGRWYPSTNEPLPPNVPRLLRRACELLYWNEAVWTIENGRQIWSANLFKSPQLRWISAPNLKALVAYVLEGVFVSLVVQIWMLPLLVYYFHRVSPAGLILNLWVGVSLAFESFAAIAAVAVASISSWLAAPLIQITEISNSVMLSLPGLLSNSGVAGFRVPIYSGGPRMIYYFYFASLVVASVRLFRWEPFALRRPKRIASGVIALIAVPTFLGALIVLHPYSSPSADGLLRVEFLDVGQGDSALVTFPDGQTMLIDGGGQPDFAKAGEDGFEPDVSRIGERVVSEFLWEKGYSSLDFIVMSHADADHAQGLIDVAKNFRVGTIVIGETRAGSPALDELFAIADRDRVPVIKVSRGDAFNVGGVQIRVLHPSGEEQSAFDSANNDSIVLHLTFGAQRFLFTGDIEREAESELDRYAESSIQAEIVKVPHHGSRTSSTTTFVESVKAEVAIISVGRRSRFGHPHPEILKRWNDSGVEVITTGSKGTVTVETDGTATRKRTFLP